MGNSSTRGVPRRRLTASAQGYQFEYAAPEGSELDVPEVDMQRIAAPARFRAPKEISDGVISMPRNSVWAWRLLFVMLSYLDEDPTTAAGKTCVVGFSDLMAAFGNPGMRNYKPIRDGIADLANAEITLTSGQVVKVLLSHEVQGLAWEFHAGLEIIDLYADMPVYTRVDFQEIASLNTNMDMALYLRLKRLVKMRAPETVVDLSEMEAMLPGRRTDRGQMARAIRKSLNKIASSLGQGVTFEFCNTRGTKRMTFLNVSLREVAESVQPSISSKSVPREEPREEELSPSDMRLASASSWVF